MEKLTIQREALEDALSTIDETLGTMEDYRETGDRRLTVALRDSLIQRFEYTFDTLWKYLKVYLVTKHGITIKAPSPSMIFRLSKDHDLISDQELALALKMVEARNETSHTYDEYISIRMAENIPEFYGFMYSLFERTPLESSS